MKVTIEKKPHGPIQVSLTIDPAKKPVVFDLRPEAVQTITQLLTTAARAESFKFEYQA